MIFLGPLCFQAAMIGLYIYTLKLEGKSKINSQALYTTWYFLPMSVLFMVNATLIVFYFPKELVNFLIMKKLTFLVELIVGLRALILVCLTMIHIYCLKNFDLQFTEDCQALTTSLMSKSKRI